MKKKAAKSVLRTIIFVAINIIVIVLIGLFEFLKKDNNVSAFPSNLRWEYFVCAFLCFVLTILIASIKVSLMIKKVFGKYSFKVAFETAVLGFYYNNITPFSVGGQPFQIYHLSRNGFSGSASAVIPMTEIVTNDMAMTLCVIFSHTFITISSIGQNISVGWKIASFVGLFFYILVPVSVLFFSRAPKTFSKVVGFGIHLLSKIHIIKHEYVVKEKTISKIKDYSKHFDYLTDSPLLLIGITLLSILQRLSVMVVPYFVIHAFGGNISFTVCLVTTIIVTSAVTFVPTPGNSGASEGVFYAIFTSLNQGYVFYATLAWRFFTYYIYILFGFLFAVKRPPSIGKSTQKDSNTIQNTEVNG